MLVNRSGGVLTFFFFDRGVGDGGTKEWAVTGRRCHRGVVPESLLSCQGAHHDAGAANAIRVVVSQ